MVLNPVISTEMKTAVDCDSCENARSKYVAGAPASCFRQMMKKVLPLRTALRDSSYVVCACLPTHDGTHCILAPTVPGLHGNA